MYNAFFGLNQFPFNLTPDPKFLYLTRSHREALAALAYAVLARKGIFVLSGDAGTGKTTLLMSTLQHLADSPVRCSVIMNPTLTPAEFLEAVLLDFGFREVPDSKARRVVLLQEYLWKVQSEGQIALLVVDEAHKLSPEVLEEVRLLGNFETAEQKLLQIVLLGQNELEQLLNEGQLRQFRQRIALRIQIHPLPFEEVGLYVHHRWTTAGGAQPPFSEQALAAISYATQGIPRLINAVCDNALLDAFADESSTVEMRHVATACRDLHLPQLALPTAPVHTAPASIAPSPVAAEFSPVLETEPDFLRRYHIEPPRRSFVNRLRSKLGFAQSTETA
jgi:general secretion pathway protein A